MVGWLSLYHSQTMTQTPAGKPRDKGESLIFQRVSSPKCVIRYLRLLLTYSRYILILQIMRYPFEHLKEHFQQSHGCDRGRGEERHFRGRGPFAGPFGDHERPFWRGRGGPGRLFASADLRFLLLDLIAEKPRHGYELIKAIEEKFGGAYSPSPGIIYPMLTLLEDRKSVV